MGYVSIFLTFTTLIYYSMFVAIPLLFLINSFRPTLPWSCEGLKSWHNRTDEYPTVRICANVNWQIKLFFR